MNKPPFPLLAALGLTIGFAQGCQSPEPMSDDAPATQPDADPHGHAERPDPLTPATQAGEAPSDDVDASTVYDDIPVISIEHGQRSTIGESVRGLPIHAYRFEGDPNLAPLLIVGGIHGSEPDSARLTQYWLERFASASPPPGLPTIVAVPFANPDGLLLGKRGNVNGVDLNRNFPAENFRARERYGTEPLSQPESRALHKLIESLNPGVILTIHQPLVCVDHDGPGSVVLAERIAKVVDLPVKKLGARPGSLGSWAGEVRGAVVVTLELPSLNDTPRGEAELWTRYGPAFDATLDYASTPPAPTAP
ncbi:MAG: M14 family zinc carboxypeptidase [Planctomycetota bacterium]